MTYRVEYYDGKELKKFTYVATRDEEEAEKFARRLYQLYGWHFDYTEIKIIEC